jgi:hypothetical protein
MLILKVWIEGTKTAVQQNAVGLNTATEGLCPPVFQKPTQQESVAAMVVYLYHLIHLSSWGEVYWSLSPWKVEIRNYCSRHSDFYVGIAYFLTYYVKFSLCWIKYHDGVDVQLHTFLNLVQGRGKWLVSRMDSFTLWGDKKSVPVP